MPVAKKRDKVQVPAPQKDVRPVRVGHRIVNLNRRNKLSDLRTGETITEDERVTFIQEFAKCGLLTTASQKAGRSPFTFRALIDNDPSFKELVEEAYDYFKDTLEDTAYKRAVNGWDEPVYQKGEMVGTIHRYSDRMLEILLRGNRPQKFRDNVKVDANITGGIMIMPAIVVNGDEWQRQYSEALKQQAGADAAALTAEQPKAQQ